MLSVFFYLFSTIAVLSAIMVIIAKNPVHSVFFLILNPYTDTSIDSVQYQWLHKELSNNINQK